MKKLSLWLIFCLFTANVLAAERFIIQVATPQQSSQLAAGGNDAETVRAEMIKPLSTEELKSLADIARSVSGTTDIEVKELRALHLGAHVILLNQNLNTKKTQAFIEHVQQQPHVVFIEEDKRLQAQSKKIKQINPLQWDMTEKSSVIPPDQIGGMWGGDNLVNAWQSLARQRIAPGAEVVVAVVDTGYTPNSNILSALQPLGAHFVNKFQYGYQMISDCRISGQCSVGTPSWQAGIEYQANGLDRGDFLTADEITNSAGFFDNCAVQNNSTWHGSHAAGIIAANGYSAQQSNGITGGAYAAKVIPIRVLGKCGGYISDITEGVLWAAGIDISDANPGVSVNKHPADVINVGLGAEAPCSQDPLWQETINRVNKRGAIIVASAGNASMDVADFTPAGCKNIISVAAKGPNDQLTSYSNIGATTIAASGGDAIIANCASTSALCTSSVYSTVWSSPQAFKSRLQGGKDAWTTYQGTSRSAAHVTAAVANIISVLKTKYPYTEYNTDSISKILQQTAAPYNNCYFSDTLCTDNDYALDTDAAIKFLLTGRYHP